MLLFPTAFFSIFLLFSCGNKSDFHGSSPTSTPTPVPADGNIVVTKPKEQSFALQGTKPKVDMIWVIDNTGSMYEVHDIVQANLTSFLSGLDDKIDLKFALISQSTTGLGGAFNGYAFDSAFSKKGFLHIPSVIGNYDELASLAAQLCSKDSSSVIAGGEYNRLCGVELDSMTFQALTDTWDTSRAPFGGLQSFLREDSQPISVFISDDDVQGLTSTNWLQFEKAFIKNNPMKFYGFVGLSNSTCTISTQGKSYSDLAAKTGGIVFDICTKDWSNNFASLSSHAANTIQRFFKLDATGNIKISEVSVDGRKLATTSYKLNSNNVLEIVPFELTLNSSKVIVLYQ